MVTPSDKLPHAIDRRRVVAGVAWAAPAVLVASASPAMATSTGCSGAGSVTVRPAALSSGGSPADIITTGFYTLTVPAHCTTITYEIVAGNGGHRRGGMGAKNVGTISVGDSSTPTVLRLIAGAGGEANGPGGQYNTPGYNKPSPHKGGTGYGAGGDCIYNLSSQTLAGGSAGGGGGSAILAGASGNTPLVVAGGGGGGAGGNGSNGGDTTAKGRLEFTQYGDLDATGNDIWLAGNGQAPGTAGDSTRWWIRARAYDTVQANYYATRGVKLADGLYGGRGAVGGTGGLGGAFSSWTGAGTASFEDPDNPGSPPIELWSAGAAGGNHATGSNGGGNGGATGAGWTGHSYTPNPGGGGGYAGGGAGISVYQAYRVASGAASPAAKWFTYAMLGGAGSSFVESGALTAGLGQSATVSAGAWSNNQPQSGDFTASGYDGYVKVTWY